MKITPPVETSRPEPSVVPLVNVVFLLLIFFMLVGRITSPDSLIVEPPRSFSGKEDAGQTFRILLARDGRVAIDKMVIPESELRDRISGMIADHPAATFQIKTDAQVDAVRLIGIMEHLQDAGVKELTLLTEQDRNP